MDGLTPNAGLSVITPTRPNWADAANNNFKILDTIIGAYFVVNSLRGIWQNSTEYAVDDSVIDSETGTLYQALVANTSSSIPTTFTQERLANPTYWGSYAAPARSRGVWMPNTSYLRDDFVVSGSQYAIALENHTSGSIFSVDVAANKWGILVDLSAAGSQVLPTPSGAGDANKFTMVNGTGTGYNILGLAAVLSIMGVTTVGQAVMQAASDVDARTAIGAQVAGSYQAQSSYLSLISGLAVTASRFPYVTSLGAAALGTTGAFGISWMALADLAAASAALGLGTAAFLNVGTGALNIVQFDGAGKYPAADGTQITGLAPLASPTFTGNPAAPTPTVGDSDTSIATTAFANPGASLGVAGYHTFPSGLIIQWGTSGAILSGGTEAEVFSIPFPTAIYGVTLQALTGPGGGDNMPYPSARTVNGFTLNNRLTYTSTFFWIALGK